MLNQTGVRKETYGNTNQILFAVEHQVSMGVVVSKALGVAEGTKKVVKAGTPLTGNLDARTTAFTAATAGSSTEASNAVGVLLHDVDVTTGDANGTLLLFGFVNTNRVDATTKAKLTDTVKKAMPMIKFVAC
nr:MAG TPA: Head decoration protein [Caudoviricetes sp.]DAM73613.1 MAG TPA: Head decoration protein [Caudoviricetes sp.]DAU61202.1 MAG TPA: Head decoration protein [Caudoviricetes sp.]